ncbi:hypothetical protein BJ138DRAFT_1118983 [Hygrophoropsis aurantiaca]|uniref:Uncharacterized protein n=1 Tax=Hygrophoropsis aurantiaca TaxID=72124 RepID=A0ACB7ZVI8_9AGAM|nr:hypothetical protein BJ138DRAFT_1118983 [Hygrophoropsis aurantiaca]
MHLLLLPPSLQRKKRFVSSASPIRIIPTTPSLRSLLETSSSTLETSPNPALNELCDALDWLRWWLWGGDSLQEGERTILVNAAAVGVPHRPFNFSHLEDRGDESGVSGVCEHLRLFLRWGESNNNYNNTYSPLAPAPAPAPLSFSGWQARNCVWLMHNYASTVLDEETHPSHSYSPSPPRSSQPYHKIQQSPRGAILGVILGVTFYVPKFKARTFAFLLRVSPSRYTCQNTAVLRLPPTPHYLPLRHAFPIPNSTHFPTFSVPGPPNHDQPDPIISCHHSYFGRLKWLVGGPMGPAGTMPSPDLDGSSSSHPTIWHPNPSRIRDYILTPTGSVQHNGGWTFDFRRDRNFGTPRAGDISKCSQ